MTIQTIHKPKKVLQTHVINVKAISNEIRHRLVVSETTAKHPNKSEAVETTSFVKAVKGQTPQWVKVSQNYFKNGTHLEFLEKNRRYNGCLHRPLHDEDINCRKCYAMVTGHHLMGIQKNTDSTGKPPPRG